MPRTGLTAPEIKEKAIDATIATMRKHGFDKVRLTAIAKQLGLSHAALYLHFKDKSALFDAVSERWLREIDDRLEAVCARPGKDPTDKLQLWMLTLHQAKLAKVLHDPELYKSFDMQAGAQKPYVRRHMDILRGQLIALITAAIAQRRLRDADPAKLAEIIWEAMMAFHHPKLVAQHHHEKREALLKRVLDSVLRGLDLKA